MDYTDSQRVASELKSKQKQLEIKAAQLALVRQLIQRQKQNQNNNNNNSTVCRPLKNCDSDETSQTAEKRFSKQEGGQLVGGKRRSAGGEGEGEGTGQLPPYKRVCGGDGQGQGQGQQGQGERKWELFDKAAKLIRKIRSHQDAEPFRKSVDTVRYGCPEYYNVVKRPMDLGTMLQKVNEDRYSNIFEVKSDLDLIWSNCFLFNGLDSRMGKIGHKLQSYSNKQWDKFVQDNKLHSATHNHNIGDVKPINMSKMHDNNIPKHLQSSSSGKKFRADDGDTYNPPNKNKKQQQQQQQQFKQKTKKQKNAIESDEDDDMDDEREDPPYAPAAPAASPPPHTHNQQQQQQQPKHIQNSKNQQHAKSWMQEGVQKLGKNHAQYIVPKKRILKQNRGSPKRASEGVQKQIIGWIQQNFGQLKEEDHPQLAKCVGVCQGVGEEDEEEAELELESYSVQQLKNLQSFMKRRIAKYQKANISERNKEIPNQRNSSDLNSEEVTSNQQSNMDDKSVIMRRGVSPFLPHTQSPSKHAPDPNNAKIMQIDSSLWKNLGQNDDNDRQNNDDDNDDGFNDSVSADSDNKQQQDENNNDDDDIWSEFQTKEEIQQQKLQQQQKIDKEQQQQQQKQQQKNSNEKENRNILSRKQEVQAKIEQEIQDLDKQAATGGGQNGGYSSNSPASGCNIRVTPSTDLLSIGLIRKKRADLDEEDYL